ncbi:TRAP transporter small permease subunit [Saccharospirillum mangrovi]|uniref:TRAP transporter small permease subunit n=1 Tax=Saccharospirillum mangrovi TaxID=2161747 RepID=UPI000D369C32|nr:TRAP transporter small permease subunit [Saccharospirillum mangrovi]
MNAEIITVGRDAEDDADLASSWLDRAIVWLGKKLSLIFAGVALIGGYEVVCRYVFNSPTIWVHETSTFFGAALFIFGGLYAFATDKHVRVVLIYDLLSERGRCLLRLTHHLFGLGFCAMMLYASSIMARKAVFAPWGAFRLETSGSAWNPPFPALLKVMVLLAIVVLTVQYLLHLLRDVRQLLGKV